MSGWMVGREGVLTAQVGTPNNNLDRAHLTPHHLVSFSFSRFLATISSLSSSTPTKATRIIITLCPHVTLRERESGGGGVKSRSTKMAESLLYSRWRRWHCGNGGEGE